jgi:O-acetyl-ADP-ribose deacetylase (regulator of RNase III)
VGSSDLDDDAHVYGCDVLVVLLEDATLESRWVQREIDLARGAHVAILPVRIASNMDAGKVMRELALDEFQYLTYEGKSSFDNLMREIDRLAAKSADKQGLMVAKLTKKLQQVKVARSQLFAQPYRLRTHDHPCRVYLAGGSIVDAHGVDIIVNTENNYMQMARVHENHTVSSVLRYLGSDFDGRGNLLEDTVQLELDEQVKALGGRPVQLGTVLVTVAGHTRSKLRHNGFKYIFHAATVEVTHKVKLANMQPMSDPDAIRECVCECLQRASQLDTELESIIFPLFGAGQAKAKPKRVAEAMLTGVERFLERNAQTPLRRIYLCAYRERDLKIVEDCMEATFSRA